MNANDCLSFTFVDGRTSGHEYVGRTCPGTLKCPLLTDNKMNPQFMDYQNTLTLCSEHQIDSFTRNRITEMSVDESLNLLDEED